MTEPAPHGAASSSASDAELLAILAELGREVTSVLDLSHLLEKIPKLISRLTSFTVFSVYLLHDEREELSIAYAVGYPEEIVKHFTLQVGQGIVGTAIAEQRPILVGDNVWIGSRSILLPGTTIGEGSVVSAASVVRGEVPPYTVVAGNPARPVGSLKEIRSPATTDGHVAAEAPPVNSA